MPKENIYDKTFKKLMNETVEVIALVKSCFPKDLAEDLDYATMKLMPDSFIDDNMNEHASDVIHSCKLKSGEEVWLNFILEHKSYLPVKPEIQLLKYISDGYNYRRQEKIPATQIIPVILYHGKEKWKIRQISDYMQHDAAYLHEYTPAFKYILIDLADYSDEEIFAMEMGFLLRHILLLFKHKNDGQYVLRETKKIFIFENPKLTQEEVNERNRIIFVFISRAFQLEEKEVKEMLEEMPETIKNIGMTTYDMFVEKGKEIGKEIKESMLAIDKSLNVMTKMPEFSLAKIADLLDYKVAFLKKLQKGFIDGDEKKARKTVYSFFDKFGKMEESEVKEIEAILKKYLPKFKIQQN